MKEQRSVLARSTSTTDEDNVDALLTVREVATQLRVDATTIRKWIASGMIAAIVLPSSNHPSKSGHRHLQRRIRTSEVDRILHNSAYVGQK